MVVLIISSVSHQVETCYYLLLATWGLMLASSKFQVAIVNKSLDSSRKQGTRCK